MYSWMAERMFSSAQASIWPYDQQPGSPGTEAATPYSDRCRITLYFIRQPPETYVSAPLRVGRTPGMSCGAPTLTTLRQLHSPCSAASLPPRLLLPSNTEISSEDRDGLAHAGFVSFIALLCGALPH